MMNDIWYSSTATQDTRYITLATVYVRHIGVHYHCSCGNAFWEKQKEKAQNTIKSLFPAVFFMIIRFVNWSMQYYSWQTNTHPQFHPRWQHTSAPTHTQRDAQFKTDIFWMLIICLQLHPTWKRDRRRKGGECQGPKWQASTFHNIPFVSLYLYSSRRLCLCTFPNESPYNSKTLISSPWHTD